MTSLSLISTVVQSMWNWLHTLYWNPVYLKRNRSGYDQGRALYQTRYIRFMEQALDQTRCTNVYNEQQDPSDKCRQYFRKPKLNSVWEKMHGRAHSQKRCIWYKGELSIKRDIYKTWANTQSDGKYTALINILQ